MVPFPFQMHVLLSATDASAFSPVASVVSGPLYVLPFQSHFIPRSELQSSLVSQIETSHVQFKAFRCLSDEQLLLGNLTQESF